jgi:hypothetical protein
MMFHASDRSSHLSGSNYSYPDGVPLDVNSDDYHKGVDRESTP